MRRKSKKNSKSGRASQNISIGKPRHCPWVVTAKAGLCSFRRLYGVSKFYAGCSDLWTETRAGELRFHFADYHIAFSFVAYCIGKGFQTDFGNDQRPGETYDLTELRKKKRPAKDDSLMVKQTPEMRTYPMRLELAGFYSDDAADFLYRYRSTFHSDQVDFQAVKSRRAKAYVDLRMALESLLKAVVCLRAQYSLAGKPLVTMIRRYSHDIEPLRTDALKNVRVDLKYIEALERCSIAPVDIRYQFDAMNFRMASDEKYYETIGSNVWLATNEEFVERGLRRLRVALGRRSKIVPGRVAAQEMKRKFDY